MNKLKSPDIKLNKPFIIKPKKCKCCKELFTPRNNLQSVCGFECSVKYTLKKREARELSEYKAERKKIKEAKEKIKTITELANETQTIFNKYVRLRDSHLPCISCKRFHDGQYHGGHYRTTKAASQLRFNEDNVHKQCAPCNNHLSGNIAEYRINLIKKIGLDRVEALENNNQSVKWTKEELNELKRIYREKIKQIDSA
jgi:DNA repair exonuclease SbcCD ATPase subunit